MALNDSVEGDSCKSDETSSCSDLDDDSPKIPKNISKSTTSPPKNDLSLPVIDANSSNEEGEQTKVEALLKAIQIMSRLASMDSSQYTATMTGSAQDASKGPFTESALTLQQQLDQLQRQWKLEETFVPTLVQQIHKLQAHVSHMDSDAQQHLLEWQETSQTHRKDQARIQQLETAVHKLHAQKEKLKHKLQKQKQRRKSIVAKVKDYALSVKKEQQSQAQASIISHQLQSHERLLKLEQQQQQGGGGNRSRCSSRDTLFSDFDMGLYHMDEHDDSSVSSVSTAHSLVTDEGIVTVRYHSEDETSTRASPLSHLYTHCSEHHHDYTLHFPSGSKIGLQLHKVPLMKGLLDQSLAGHESDDATGEAKSVKSCPEGDARHSSSEPRSQTNKESSFLDNLLGKTKPPENNDSSETSVCAFLVCGEYGFDSQLNVRPTLGARLIKVNGECVDTWTLEQIKEETHHNPRDFTMTFRNEPLNRQQREILSKAIQAAADKHEPKNEHSKHKSETKETCNTPTNMFQSLLQLQHPNSGGGDDDLRKRAYSDSNVGRRESMQSTEGETKDKGSGRSIKSFLQQRSRSADAEDSDAVKDPTVTVSHKSTVPTEETSSSGKPKEAATVPSTPPQQKLKKSMKSMGKTFKGWMS